jgi:hypothetical protein
LSIKKEAIKPLFVDFRGIILFTKKLLNASFFSNVADNANKSNNKQDGWDNRVFYRPFHIDNMK